MWLDALKIRARIIPGASRFGKRSPISNQPSSDRQVQDQMATHFVARRRWPGSRAQTAASRRAAPAPCVAPGTVTRTRASDTRCADVVVHVGGVSLLGVIWYSY